MVVCKGLVGALTGLSLWAMAGAANAGYYLPAGAGAPPEDMEAAALGDGGQAAMFELSWRSHDPTIGAGEPEDEIVLHLHDPAGWSAFWFHSLSAGNYGIALGRYPRQPLSAGGGLLLFAPAPGR